MQFPITTAAEKAILFSSEDTGFQLANEEATAEWIERVIEKERKTLVVLSYIFCSDDYLHELNVEYLGHDTLTDVITFPYCKPPSIEGDIFISVDRVRENAVEFGVSFERELQRVMAHGVLHLCGYLDETDEQEKLMREKEDEALALLRK